MTGKIVVLGSTGMLGHKMVERLRVRYTNVIGLSRREGLDAVNQTETRELLAQINPQVVINCVGVVKQRRQEEYESIAVNALFPHFLKRICDNSGARLIHFSTDCVFSGKHGNNSDFNTPDPEDLYGRTKLLGEVYGDNELTIRTSIIGREKNNYRGLLEWFLRQRGEVYGYKNSIFSGVTTNWLSDTVATLLEDKYRIRGLWQIASQPISKFRLLELIKEVYGKRDVKIILADGPDCDRSLDGFMFEQASKIETPGWYEMLRDQYDQDKEKYAL